MVQVSRYSSQSILVAGCSSNKKGQYQIEPQEFEWLLHEHPEPPDLQYCAARSFELDDLSLFGRCLVVVLGYYIEIFLLFAIILNLIPNNGEGHQRLPPSKPYVMANIFIYESLKASRRNTIVPPKTVSVPSSRASRIQLGRSLFPTV